MKTARLCNGIDVPFSIDQITPISQYRFWSRVDQQHGPPQSNGLTPCWPWLGAQNRKGYGHLFIKRKCIDAHRVAYILTYGTIPLGLWVLHTCDNPRCCNPSHLELGTHQQNMHDMVRKNRAARGPKAYGEQHGRAKLSLADIHVIRSTNASGVQLAHRFGVTPGAISKIRCQRTWNKSDR